MNPIVSMSHHLNLEKVNSHLNISVWTDRHFHETVDTWLGKGKPRKLTINRQKKGIYVKNIY